MKLAAASLLVATALGVALAPARAAEPAGWFFGITPARTELPAEAWSLANPAGTVSEPGLKLSAGYRFGPYLGVEARYLDLGRLTLAVPLRPLGSEGLRPKGLQLSTQGTLEVTRRLGLFGKVGAAWGSVDNSCAAIALTCSPTERGTDLSYGVGLRYDFTQTVSVRGEWERMYRFGDRGRFGDGSIDLYTIGVGFRF